MIQINKKNSYKLAFTVLFLLIIGLAAMIIYPYLTPILLSAFLAYMFHPVYRWMNSRIKRKNLTAFIVSMLIIILLVIPISFTLYHLSKEANVGYVLVKQKLGPRMDGCEEGFFCRILNSVKEAANVPEARFYIEDSIKKISSFVAQGTLNFIFSLPARMLELFLTFFFTFFMLRDGKDIIRSVEKYTPLEISHKKSIIKQTHEVIRGIIYGFFVIAIVEGSIGAITFQLFNIPSPIIWGLVIAFLTFIPFIGGAIVWVPAVIIKVMEGSIGAAIGITVGGLIISYIDTFLRPRIIGKKAAIHPAVILIGLLGGLKLIGIAGILIGPIILSLLILFFKIHIKGRR